MRVVIKHFQNYFSCNDPDQNYRFCEHFNKIGPVDVALALRPHNINNI